MTLSREDTARRYIAVIQDGRGYPAGGKPEKAPPEGPEQPRIYSVVKTDDYEAVLARLQPLDRDDFEQLVTDILVALDDWTDLPDGPTVDDARESVMRELLSFERMRSAS